MLLITYLILYKTNSRFKSFVAKKAIGLSQLDVNAKSEKILKHHCYNPESGEIEFVTQNEKIYEVLKDVKSTFADIFSCPSCKVVHISIRNDPVFIGFTLCGLCTNAIDLASTVPFVIINARTGERHRFELRLLK